MTEIAFFQCRKMLSSGHRREAVAETVDIPLWLVDQIADDMVYEDGVDIPALVRADYCRPIPDYPDYFATRGGDIVSMRRGTPLVMAQFVNRRYYSVKIRTADGGAVRFVHSLVAAAFHGPRPAKDIQTRHLDGNRFNNRPQNVVWGTCSENRQDAIRHGTAHLLKSGEANLTHRITEAQALDMVQRRAAGEPYKDIAQRYGISTPHAWNVVNGKRWRHLQPGSEAA